ncbi:MAG: LamG-like jellyroll fold domain-containing protein [bacterium]
MAVSHPFQSRTHLIHSRYASPAAKNFAISFDGNDRVVVPNHISLNPQEITVETWVKFRRLTYNSGPVRSRAQEIIVKGGDRTGGMYQLQQDGLAIESTRFNFRTDPVQARRVVYSQTQPLQANKWYHIAGTYDGRMMRIYVNGELQGSANLGTITLGNDSPLYFGFMDVPGLPYYLDGVIDEIRIWSYARTELEIQETMYKSLNGNEANLLAYWNFDEGAGQVVNDLTGNRNAGQLGTTAGIDGEDPDWIVSDRPTGEGVYGVNITAINPALFSTVSVTARIADTTGNAVAGLDSGNFILRENGVRREIIDLKSNFFDSTKADFVFVFDTTASMQNQIDAVKARARSFADSLARRGVDYALGLVSYGDDYRILNNNALTRDINLFQNWVNGLVASGGGDRPENPFDALVAAAQMNFRAGAQRIFILITDAPAHTRGGRGSPTGLALPDVVAALVSNNIICHVVGPRLPTYQGTGSLSRATGGRFFDMTADFTGILNEIITFITGQYEIKFLTAAPIADGSRREVSLQAFQRGRTGVAVQNYLAPDKTVQLQLASDPLHYSYGDSFWIAIGAGAAPWPAKGLFSASLILTYDKNILRFIDKQAGAFLGQNPLFNVFVDTASGSIFAGISKKSGAGAMGSGTLARFRFRSVEQNKSAVQTRFCLTTPVAYDSIAVQMPVLLPECLAMTFSPGEDTTFKSVTVWPGDTDNNGQVNGVDVLFLGVNWAGIGPARRNASTAWFGQQAQSWIPESSTYADADGNGVVEMPDMAVVDLNWGKTHAPGSMLPTKINREVKGTMRLIQQKSRGEMEKFSLIQSGTENIAGVALTLTYPQACLRFEQALPLAATGSDFLWLVHDEPEAGRLSLAIVYRGDEKKQFLKQELAEVKLRKTTGQKVGEKAKIERATWLAANGTLFEFAAGSQGGKSTQTPAYFQLEQNYPNPFNPSTTFRYALPHASGVVLAVYDLIGRRVINLVNEQQPAGWHQVQWRGVDRNGMQVSSGFYFVRFAAGDFRQTRKILLLK